MMQEKPSKMTIEVNVGGVLKNAAYILAFRSFNFPGEIFHSRYPYRSIS
jgi:hypothetical protein